MCSQWEETAVFVYKHLIKLTAGLNVSVFGHPKKECSVWKGNTRNKFYYFGIKLRMARFQNMQYCVLCVPFRLPFLPLGHPPGKKVRMHGVGGGYQERHQHKEKEREKGVYVCKRKREKLKELWVKIELKTCVCLYKCTCVYVFETHVWNSRYFIKM